MCAKNYENWLAVEKDIAKIIRLTYFGPPCITYSLYSLLLTLLIWL